MQGSHLGHTSQKTMTLRIEDYVFHGRTDSPEDNHG
jgi:hypothetical protein